MAEIAERAGLTERTFYRHFADKREVLFGGSAALLEGMVDAVTSAPGSASPLEAVTAGLDAAGTVLEPRRDRARQRQAVIAANDELRERELIKMASLADALAAALRRRKVKEPVATLTAESGIAVFRVAFDRWVKASGRRGLSHYVHESLEQLKAVTAGS